MSNAPFYLPIADEVQLFTAAWQCRLPVLLRGPTGCGKTRFVEHMAASLLADRPTAHEVAARLISVACHEGLSSGDLTGRQLLRGEQTTWEDGPLTRAVRRGAICYLDELAEAREDTIALIHPLTDHRRSLPLDKLGELLPAHPDFMLVISYNPGHQGATSELAQSTRQRFVTIDLDYAPPEQEALVVQRESGVSPEIARSLSALGYKVRSLKGSGLEEGVSTRLLVYAARLIRSGVPARRACDATIARSLTDDSESTRAINELASAAFK